MAKSKWNYKCPRCGSTVGTDIDPKYRKTPLCENYAEHHSRKMFEMEEIK